MPIGSPRFDNDGTLWVEQPLLPQFDFVFGHCAAEVKADPSLAGQQPYEALIERHPAFRLLRTWSGCRAERNLGGWRPARQRDRRYCAFL